jgi:hypothetical protein
VNLVGRFPWPRGSAAARLMGFCVRIPPCAWMSVCCECSTDDPRKTVCLLPRPNGSTAPVGQSLLIVEVVRSHRHTALDITPLDEGSARRTDLYLITHNTDKWQTYRAATVIGRKVLANNMEKGLIGRNWRSPLPQM